MVPVALSAMIIAFSALRHRLGVHPPTQRLKPKPCVIDMLRSRWAKEFKANAPFPNQCAAFKLLCLADHAVRMQTNQFRVVQIGARIAATPAPSPSPTRALSCDPARCTVCAAASKECCTNFVHLHTLTGNPVDLCEQCAASSGCDAANNASFRDSDSLHQLLHAVNRRYPGRLKVEAVLVGPVLRDQAHLQLHPQKQPVELGQKYTTDPTLSEARLKFVDAVVCSTCCTKSESESESKTTMVYHPNWKQVVEWEKLERRRDRAQFSNEGVW